MTIGIQYTRRTAHDAMQYQLGSDASREQRATRNERRLCFLVDHTAIFSDGVRSVSLYPAMVATIATKSDIAGNIDIKSDALEGIAFYIDVRSYRSPPAFMASLPGCDFIRTSHGSCVTLIVTSRSQT